MRYPYTKEYYYRLEHHLHIGGDTHLGIDTLVRHIDSTERVKGFPQFSQHGCKIVWILNSTGWKGVKGQHGHGVRLGWIGEILEVKRWWRSSRCIGVFGNKDQEGGSFEQILVRLKKVVCLFKHLDDIVVSFYRP